VLLPAHIPQSPLPVLQQQACPVVWAGMDACELHTKHGPLQCSLHWFLNFTPSAAAQADSGTSTGIARVMAQTLADTFLADLDQLSDDDVQEDEEHHQHDQQEQQQGEGSMDEVRVGVCVRFVQEERACVRTCMRACVRARVHAPP